MMEARLIFMAIVCLCIAQLAFAQEPYPFKSQQAEQRYVRLVKGIRCSVCQNQSLFESNAAIAVQMRSDVHDMLDRGMSDRAIRLQLRKQYGDKIFFMPPIRTSTIILWLGPIIMLLIGYVAFKNYTLRKHTMAGNYAC